MPEDVADKPNRITREVYTRVLMPKFTDQDLAAHDFVIDAPLLLPGLSSDEPPRDQDLTLVGRYKLRDTVQCVFGHRHNNGYAFRSQDGRHFLVGAICGTKVMGVDEWAAFDRQQIDLEQRAQYLRQIFSMQEAFRRKRDWIVRLRVSPTILALADVRKILATRTDLIAAMRSAFSYKDGRVDKFVKIRNLQKEIAREEREQEEVDRFSALSDGARSDYLKQRKAPSISTAPIEDEILTDIGTLFGRSLVLPNIANPKDIGSMIDIIDNLLSLETVSIQTPALKRLSIQGRAVIDNLLSIVDEVDDAIQFFTHNNLEVLTVWANDRHFDGCSYAHSRRALRINDEEAGHRILIGQPAELRVIDAEELNDLKASKVAFRLEIL